MEHGLPFADSILFQGCCLYSDAECILQRIDIDCFLNIGNLILFDRADGGEEIAYLQQTGAEVIIRSLIIGRNNERTNFGLGFNVVFISRLAVLRIELERKFVAQIRISLQLFSCLAHALQEQHHIIVTVCQNVLAGQETVLNSVSVASMQSATSTMLLDSIMLQ